MTKRLPAVLTFQLFEHCMNTLKSFFCPSGAKEKTHKIHLHETTLLITQKRCTPHMENKVTVLDINPTWQEEAVPGYNPLKADVGTPHIPIKVAYFLCQAGV